MVVIDNEAIDDNLEIDGAFEDAALQTSIGEDCEEAFDGIKPTGRGWGEVESPARMSAKPFDHLECR